MAEYLEQVGALGAPEMDALRRELLASPYIGRSPLAGCFDGSRGFAVTFRLDGLGQVLERFPFLGPFLERAITPASLRAVLPWYLRALPSWGWGPLPNAFYCNVLLLEPGHGVGMHVDGTLRAESGNPDIMPRLVSVLYIQRTEGARGGQLRLFRGLRPVGAIEPEPGKLVHFRGDLRHEVQPFEGVEGQDGDALRISLVCEQYFLPPHELERIPACSLHSKNAFKMYLAERLSKSASAQE